MRRWKAGWWASGVWRKTVCLAGLPNCCCAPHSPRLAWFSARERGPRHLNARAINVAGLRAVSYAALGSWEPGSQRATLAERIFSAVPAALTAERDQCVGVLNQCNEQQGQPPTGKTSAQAAKESRFA